MLPFRNSRKPFAKRFVSTRHSHIVHHFPKLDITITIVDILNITAQQGFDAFNRVSSIFAMNYTLEYCFQFSVLNLRVHVL